MKKVFLLSLVLIAAFSFWGCNNDDEIDEPAVTETVTEFLVNNTWSLDSIMREGIDITADSSYILLRIGSTNFNTDGSANIGLLSGTWSLQEEDTYIYLEPATTLGLTPFLLEITLLNDTECKLQMLDSLDRYVRLNYSTL